MRVAPETGHAHLCGTRIGKRGVASLSMKKDPKRLRLPWMIIQSSSVEVGQLELWWSLVPQATEVEAQVLITGTNAGTDADAKFASCLLEEDWLAGAPVTVIVHHQPSPSKPP